MYDYPKTSPIEILFQDQVILNNVQSQPSLVLLQLTSESLIIKPINITKISSVRNVTIKRDSNTCSLGFSIKGGKDTGFPVLISRVMEINSHLLHIGDAILTINNEDITNLTHDEVIKKLRETFDNQVHLTVQYMNEMATYLHLTTPKLRASIATLPRTSSIKLDLNRMSAEYSSENYSNIKAIITNQQETNFQEYPLLYAYVTQYINGTDQLYINSFELHIFDGTETGLIITKTSTEQMMWISRINMIIRHLTTRILSELNQTLLSSEQVFYANWIYERINNLNDKWQAVFLVFKGSDLYIFDENKTPPLCAYDFICCKRVYSIIEIFIETISFKSCLDNRRYCFTLTLANDLKGQYHYLNFERKMEYDDFILNYQRALYISVYSIQNRIFGCIYQGQICRFIIDINKGFEMYNNQTDILLWSFTFEQLQASSDNGRDKIYFQFKSNVNESTIHIEVQCQYLRVLVHAINAFLTVKFISQRDNIID